MLSDRQEKRKVLNGWPRAPESLPIDDIVRSMDWLIYYLPIAEEITEISRRNKELLAAVELQEAESWKTLSRIKNTHTGHFKLRGGFESLGDLEKEEMKRMRKCGATLDLIAKLFGCSSMYISRLCRGHTR